MHPRANVLGLILNEDYILLEEKIGKHSKGEGHYYRPIGGTIELGERSDETLIREFKEELNVEVNIINYISCIENIFQIDGEIGHEITQLYCVEFKNKNLYQQKTFKVTEGNSTTIAKWIDKKEIYSEDKIVYPNGLNELLKNGI